MDKQIGLFRDIKKTIFYNKINEKNEINDLKTCKMFNILLINHAIN